MVQVPGERFTRAIPVLLLELLEAKPSSHSIRGDHISVIFIIVPRNLALDGRLCASHLKSVIFDRVRDSPPRAGVGVARVLDDHAGVPKAKAKAKAKPRHASPAMLALRAHERGHDDDFGRPTQIYASGYTVHVQR